MFFFNPLLFSNCFFVFFGFLCFARSTKNFDCEKSLFPLFISLFWFSCLLSFFSLLMFLSRGSDDRGQKTSPREMSEGGGGNGHQCLTRRSLVGVFLSMTEGLSWWTWINQGECLGWWFLARFGSNGVFLLIEWLVCDTDSPQDMRWWKLIIISLCSLSPLLFSSCLHPFLNTWQNSYWKDWATWGGEAEPGGFDGLCRRSREDRARKTNICGKATERLGRGNKQTGR